ncbi:SDR family NAD(P)-dependent oxidoreductase [Nocardia sp. NPDC046763]|uniref:type I polyketide synthase n=1 Tax=Nocardia sp. NPDC046763 TaxID=3155256 RepID=UPI0033EA2035
MTTAGMEPVAIVGMAGRFPGAADIEALWELLNTGGDAIRPVPEQRWDTDAPLDRERRIQAVGGFIDGVAEFDAAFFAVSPREAADIDPQQRLMLEMAWRAVEDGRARPDELRGSRTGVYIGASWHDYEILRKQRGLGASQHSSVGNALDVIASRVSYTLGLTGPSMTVETGCSSALVGLDLAVRAIRSGDIDAALVGGVNLILAPDVSVGLTYFGGLSEDGRCAAFGVGANGFVRGEGVIAIYLKPLRAALRDGDRVRAVIAETVVNNDGGGESLVTPSSEGQRDLLRRAYPTRALDIDTLAYVEAHGTGTRRGDPIEARALGEILGAGRAAASGPLLIGSVKTNIGHLEAAAGIAGLVKAVLCLEHGVVPPSLHSGELSPDIDFDELNVRVVREHSVLPDGDDVRIGVNSFGWGGTNAHVVLRRAPRVAPETAPSTEVAGFLPVSAHTATALRQRCRDLADLLDAEPDRVAPIVAALSLRAPAQPLRAAVLSTAPDELAAALRAHADEPAAESPSTLSGRAREIGRTAFVFPGQGGQWHGLSAALYGRDAEFTAAVDTCAGALRPHVDWDPVAVLSGAAGPGWLERVDQVQPVLWALSLGIAACWRRAGIVPDVVVGHSQGEIAAATVAGLLNVDDAALIVARRSALLRSVAGTGRMLAVELPVTEIPAAIAGFEDLVALAVHNGPTSCVLSGDADAIEALSEILGADGVFCRMVNVDYASHSPGMAAVRIPLQAELAGVAPLPGEREMFSTVRVGTVGPEDLIGDYWVENLCNPVLFADAINALFDTGVTHVVEIGPHPVLLPAVEQLAAERADAPRVLPSFYRDCDPGIEWPRSLARAFVAGLRPFAAVGSTTQALPRYPLLPQSHWLPDAGPARLEPAVGTHRIPLYPSTIEAGTWHATLPVDPAGIPWLADHVVGDAVVVPGAFWAVLALAVARTRFGADTVSLSGLRFVEMLTLGAMPSRVEITLRQDFAAGASFEIAALDTDAETWTVHARGRALRTPDSGAAPRPFPSLPGEPLPGDELPVAEFYATCARRGVDLGPNFQGLCELRRGRDEAGEFALGRIVLSESARATSHPGELHATLVDCAMQTALALFEGEHTILPGGIDELLLDGRPAGHLDTAWAYAVRRSDATADIHVFDDERAPLARILGLELLAIEDVRAETGTHDRELSFLWQAATRVGTGGPAGTFAVTGFGDAVAELTAALRRGGATVGVEQADTIVHLAPPADAGLDLQRRGLLELRDLVTACVRSSAATPRLVVVTTAAQAIDPAECPDPGGALYWGFARVLRREHPELSTEIIDLAAPELGAPHRRFDECAAELLARTGEDQIVLRTGAGRYVGRLEQGEQPENTAAVRPWHATTRTFQLVGAAGRIGAQPHLRPFEVRSPESGEVVIDIEAAAVDYLDALRAVGTSPGDAADRNPLGLACAGVIRAVGPGVTDRAVGDRVVACGFGSLATHLTVRADHTQPIPDAMSAELAAALPMAITTAWYAFTALARLEPGETVLIHSAATVSGRAALRVARELGARIIATTATAAERDELRRDHGLEDVFDSRTPEWADAVRAVTGGRGVDVVLDPLTGSTDELGLRVLAEDGRFLAVGASDIRIDRRIGLRQFANGITLAAVDVPGLMVRRPERFAAALREAWQRVGVRAAAPGAITVGEFTGAAALLAAFAGIEQESRGALVLTGPSRVTDIAPDPLPEGRFRAHGTYVITGGHGALGRSLADHLLANGAGAVALIGMNAPDAVEAAGLHSYRADVADAAELASALDAIRAQLPPLRGVFHAAGILDDATILGLEADRLERVLRPKIDGARHLDTLTADDPLDLFVLFSSAAALIGSSGQAAYVAANAYLDALALARRHAGRPGLSIQWGYFADVGLAAAQDDRRARLIERGITSYTTGEAWHAMAGFLAQDRAVAGYMAFDPRLWFDAYPDAAAQPSWQLLRQRSALVSTVAGAVEFHAALADSTAAGRHVLVRDKITEVAARVLRMHAAELDSRTPFKALGLDSLMSLELRNRLESAFGLRLSPTLLWTYGTAETLAGAIGERLTDTLPTVPVTVG